MRARDGAGFSERMSGLSTKRMSGLSKRTSGRKTGSTASTSTAAQTPCICRGRRAGQHRDHGYEREDFFHEPVPCF